MKIKKIYQKDINHRFLIVKIKINEFLHKMNKIPILLYYLNI